jgi:hypothetical protein
MLSSLSSVFFAFLARAVNFATVDFDDATIFIGSFELERDGHGDVPAQ